MRAKSFVIVIALLVLQTGLTAKQEPVANCGGHSNRHSGPFTVSGTGSSYSASDAAAASQFAADCKAVIDALHLICEYCPIPGSCTGFPENFTGSGASTIHYETKNPHVYHTEILCPNSVTRLTCTTCD